MRVRFVPLAAVLLLAASAHAQRPIFEPDDFVDPSMHDRPIFLSRLVAGGVWNQSDRFRPVGGDAGLVVLANSIYFQRFQLDYDHAEFIGRDEPKALRRCDCPDPVYFPTPPPAGATPAGPSSERSDTIQLAFYRTGATNTLRYRFSWSRQPIDTVVLSANGQESERRSGHDQSFTLDADTHFAIGGREVWGSLYFARASRSGTPAGNGSQNEAAYVYRPRGFAAGPFLFRGKLAVGAISNRGGSALNLVNPYFEAFWRHHKTKVNVHLIWSGEWTQSRLEGWRDHHQIALYLDRTLFVKIFGRANAYSPPASTSPAAPQPGPR